MHIIVTTDGTNHPIYAACWSFVVSLFPPCTCACSDSFVRRRVPVFGMRVGASQAGFRRWLPTSLPAARQRRRGLCWWLRRDGSGRTTWACGPNGGAARADAVGCASSQPPRARMRVATLGHIRVPSQRGTRIGPLFSAGDRHAAPGAVIGVGSPGPSATTGTFLRSTDRHFCTAKF